MKNNHTLKQLYYSPRTAIEAEILFAARVIQVRFLKRPSGKTPLEQNSSGKKIGAESAVLHFVFFIVMVNKMQQSAKENCLLKRKAAPEVFPLTAILAGSGKTMPFEKRRSRYKETAENKAEAYRVYVEHLFSACDAVDARIFSKGDGIDRVIKTLLPDGSEQKNEYEIEDTLQVTIATDPLENKSVTKKDARGNIREVERRDKADNLLTKGRYEYSVLGEMLRAYDANENIVSVTYDLLGRRVALESKDTGRKEWRYDSKGLLEAESDSLLRSKLSEIQYVYDGFDRLVKIDYPFSEDVMYEYGVPGQAGAGEIVHKKDESGEISYKYGKLSEVVEETRTIQRYEVLSKPETATFTYCSDYLGRMQTMKYPDGETITYTYDKGGQLKGVSGVKNTVKGTETYSYIDTIVYDEHGQRVYIKYGNGVETRYRYDDKRRWLKDIETRNKQTDEVFQKISYRFDKVGNVLGYSNDASVYETSQSYTYDSLYQLIGVEGTSNQYKAIKSFGSTPVHVAKYKQDFAFDGIGNMTKKTSTTNISGARGNAYPNADLDYSLDYEYDPAYAHRLVHAGNRYYRYDANGNITAEKDGPFTEDDEFIFTYNYDPDTDVYGTDYGFGLDAPKETEETHPENLFAYRRNYTWNEKNLLTKSSDRTYTVHYRYGEDGQRALKYTEEGRSETLYFNNFYTIHIPVQDKNNPQGLRVHKHIFVGNSRLVTAMTHTDNNGDNAEQREKRYYYHSDHLGSAQFVTDWRGRQYEHIEYTPYGELWIEEVAAGLDKLPFRFTGKEMDEETGLYYYGARYLDPKYSRWLSGDPALGEYMSGSSVGAGGIYNTVNFNVYHYGNNNPIKYTDPTGMWIDNGDGTYTAEKGDTLWDKYGADWKEKSGFTRDPKTLQIGETVGEKNIPTYSDASAEMKQQIPQGNAQDSNQNVVASKKSNDVAFSYGFGGKLALVLGLGAESGFIGDTSGNLYWYLSGSVGCGIQTPSTTKTDLSTLQYLKSAKGLSGGVSLDPTQVGKSSSLTADICLGVTGTYDLNNQKSSGLPNSWGFGSVGGGVWKTGTIVVPIYKKER